MGLIVMLLGLVLFIGPHLFVTMREARARVIDQWQLGRYKLAFSVASAIGIVLIAYGFSQYRATGWVQLWAPPAWTRHIPVVLMWPSIVLILAAYLPGFIKQKTRHPMLAGVKLWAFSHLLANGDLGSLILFGSFLAWAVYSRIAAKRREPAHGASVVHGSWKNDATAVVVGTLVYLAVGYVFHPVVIGVPAFGR